MKKIKATLYTNKEEVINEAVERFQRAYMVSLDGWVQHKTILDVIK